MYIKHIRKDSRLLYSRKKNLYHFHQNLSSVRSNQSQSLGISFVFIDILLYTILVMMKFMRWYVRHFWNCTISNLMMLWKLQKENNLFVFDNHLVLSLLCTIVLYYIFRSYACILCSFFYFVITKNKNRSK